ncbi:carboxylesterase family protein [Planosporangium mesophilum]|nr:carboxylesterase family protein [Planosporangium mesophilum]NJC86848.1 carboxylesterase family protein [Planosporangium mesophilum]
MVTTTGGRVRGARVADGVLAFRGIPYAAPPFGPGRLRAPQPASAWDGVLDAVDFGPIPPQPTMALPGMPTWTPDDGDDILTVNVWVPEQSHTGLPVLVWIYGGAYTSGCADTYNPTELVRTGLVVVTFNYRVGFEGFGHVPGAPDNRGLLDQVAALRWVRENIAAFGGEPDNVTIAGESAGAGSVIALAVMPSAAGLFRRAIAHSVPSEFLSVRAAETIGARIAEAAGVPATLDALAGVPPQRLIDAATSVAVGFRQDPAAGQRYYLPTIFDPVVDGDVLPDTPLNAVAAGAAVGVDLLFAHTLDEFRLFSVGGTAPALTTDAELAAVAAAFGLSAERLADYRALVPDAAVPDVYAMIMTDFLFGEYTTRLAEAAAQAGGNVFLARFAWQSRAFGGALKACHAADVPFSFGDVREDNPFVGMLLDGPPTEQDLALAARMVRAWADFAATGDPGWQAVTAEATPVKIWDLTDRMDTDTGSGTRALWKGIDFPPVEL